MVMIRSDKFMSVEKAYKEIKKTTFCKVCINCKRMGNAGRIKYDCDTVLCPANNRFSIKEPHELEFGDVISSSKNILECVGGDVTSFFILTKYDARIIKKSSRVVVYNDEK